MNQPLVKRLLPARPAVPPRFWITMILETIAGLNLVFYSEIWSNSLRAYRVAQVMPMVGAVVIITEAIAVLWRWPDTYTGPYWARALFRLAVTGAVFGLAVVGIILAFSIAIILSYDEI